MPDPGKLRVIFLQALNYPALALEAARVRLNLLAALALTGDAAKGGAVLPKLNSWGYRFASTYQALNKGAHVAHDGDLRLLTGDASNLVIKIRTTLT